MNRDSQLIAEAYQSIYKNQVDESFRGALAGAVMGLMSLFSGQQVQGQVSNIPTTSEVNPQPQINNNTAAGLKALAGAANQANAIQAQYNKDWQASMNAAKNDPNWKNYTTNQKKTDDITEKYYADLTALRNNLKQQFNLDDNKFERLIGYATNYQPDTYRGLMKLSLATSTANSKAGLNQWIDTVVHNSQEDLANDIKQLGQVTKGIQQPSR